MKCNKLYFKDYEIGAKCSAKKIMGRVQNEVKGGKLENRLDPGQDTRSVRESNEDANGKRARNHVKMHRLLEAHHITCLSKICPCCNRFPLEEYLRWVSRVMPQNKCTFDCNMHTSPFLWRKASSQTY